MKKNTKRVGIIGTAVVALAGTGVAYAAFTGTGAVTAGGKVADAPSAINATGTVTDLYPGRCSDVTVSFQNDNDHAATVSITSANVNALLSSLRATFDDSGLNNAWLHVNTNNSPALVLPANAQNLAVPVGKSADITIGNMLCLSPNADNTVAGKKVTLTGSNVPFTFANETEYKG